MTETQGLLNAVYDSTNRALRFLAPNGTYVPAKGTLSISGADPYGAHIDITGLANDLQYGLYITDDATNNGRCIEIDHRGTGTTGGSFQARGLDILNRPGAGCALVIHQYSHADTAMYLDNTYDAPLMLLRNTENQTNNPGHTGTGHFIEFDGYDLTAFTDGSITNGTKAFTSVAMGLLTTDAGRVIAGTGIVAENLATSVAATTIASVPVTTITSGSNGASLPQGTINVASTTGFEASGTILVTTGSGQQQVAYTGKTSTTFTGCTLGTGAMSTGGDVRQAVLSANATATSAGVLAFTVTRTVVVLGDLARTLAFVGRNVNYPWTFTASVAVPALTVTQAQAAIGMVISQTGNAVGLSVAQTNSSVNAATFSGVTDAVKVSTSANASGNTLFVQKNGTTTGTALAVQHKGSSTSAIIDCQNATVSVFQILVSGQMKNMLAANEATGAGSAALGANCPAVTATAPYTWWKVTTSDGSQGYVPVWK